VKDPRLSSVLVSHETQRTLYTLPQVQLNAATSIHAAHGCGCEEHPQRLFGTRAADWQSGMSHGRKSKFKRARALLRAGVPSGLEAGREHHEAGSQGQAGLLRSTLSSAQ